MSPSGDVTVDGSSERNAEELGGVADVDPEPTGLVDDGHGTGSVQIVVQTLADPFQNRRIPGVTSTPSLESVHGSGHGVRGPLPFAPIRVLQNGQPDGPGIPFPTESVDEDQIAETLGHLRTVHEDHGHVHPVSHEGGSRGGLTLRSFTLVMGEDEVATATVKVDRLAQLAQRERAAFDVPTRTSGSPHRFPRGLVVGRRMPEDEVERISLGRIVDVTATFTGEGDHLLAGVMTHGAETGELADVEVHRARRDVRVPPFENHADEAPDVGNRR